MEKTETSRCVCSWNRAKEKKKKRATAAFSSSTRRNEFRRGDRVIAYPSHMGWPIIRAGSLTFTGPPPIRKRKAIEECTAEVLYKLDVSRIFPARRCASGYRFRDKVAILIRYKNYHKRNSICTHTCQIKHAISF